MTELTVNETAAKTRDTAVAMALDLTAMDSNLLNITPTLTGHHPGVGKRTVGFER